jgi:glycerol uptake facilitator-like aquaporin
MDQRIKLFGIIGIVGFIAGVLAALVYEYFIPWLKEVLPSFSDFTVYIVAGIAGAIIAVVLIFIWAAVSGKKDRYY